MRNVYIYCGILILIGVIFYLFHQKVHGRLNDIYIGDIEPSKGRFSTKIELKKKLGTIAWVLNSSEDLNDESAVSISVSNPTKSLCINLNDEKIFIKPGENKYTFQVKGNERLRMPVVFFICDGVSSKVEFVIQLEARGISKHYNFKFVPLMAY